MEKIEEQLNNIISVEIPSGSHQLIMQKVKHNRIKPMLFALLAVFAISFVAIIWSINIKLIEAEFFDMMKDFFKDFILSFSFVDTILGSFFEIVSPVIVFASLVNLFGIVFILKKLKMPIHSINLETIKALETY